MVMATMVRQASAILPGHGLVLPRLICQDLLPPALLAAKPLISPVHVHVFGRAEHPPAQEAAGPREAARMAAVARRRPADHRLEDDVAPLRVLVLDEDL